MKRVFIIHCWEGYPEYCWYPSVKRGLEEKGFEVQVPEMPETDFPKLKKWFPTLRQAVGKPDKDTYLVGHSVGCITILRYLESLGEGEQVGGAVFVAGFTDDLNFEELKNFFETPIDFGKARSHCPKFLAIHSDNDPFVALKYGDILKEKLGAELIIKHDMGHFSGSVDDEKSCTKLPDVVESVVGMSR